MSWHPAWCSSRWMQRRPATANLLPAPGSGLHVHPTVPHGICPSDSASAKFALLPRSGSRVPIEDHQQSLSYVSCVAYIASSVRLSEAICVLVHRGFPTFHIYSRGKKVDEIVGADRGGLRAKIDAAARSLAPLDGALSPFCIPGAAKSPCQPSPRAHAVQMLH